MGAVASHPLSQLLIVGPLWRAKHSTALAGRAAKKRITLFLVVRTLPDLHAQMRADPQLKMAQLKMVSRSVQVSWFQLHADPHTVGVCVLVQLCDWSLGAVRIAGGITPQLFALAILPLLSYSMPHRPEEVRMEANQALSRLSTATALISTCDAAPPCCDSPAARCAPDALCLIFSHLDVREWLIAQRVCRS